MKINNLGNIKNIKKSNQKKNVDSSFSTFFADEAKSEAVSSAQPVNNLNGLIDLQEIVNYDEEKKQFLENSGQLLVMLKQIQVDLINNNLSLDQMSSYQNKLDKLSIYFNSVELNELYNDIKLRLAIEIEKINQSYKY